ncbi:MAG: class I SAM-dependent methyltransferase [Anaerolineae bacterium]|nr:class I SAM-dependent methyltransferase [Anaerolineae bacterium]
MNFKDYVTLLRLTRRRLNSEDSYREFQKFQGELLVKFLKQHAVPMDGVVADVACGYGGYSLALSEAGARVVGFDLSTGALSDPLSLVLADALALPVTDEAFDLVICTSLIEHVKRPEQLLMGLYRIIRPGGVVYLGFPPFYSPRGGHHFSPFHYLGEHHAVRLARRFGRWRNSGWIQENYPLDPESYATAYGAWGLYPLTIGKFERLLRQTPFHVRHRSTRLLPVDFSGIPILREVLTWHVQYLLEKPGIISRGVLDG